MEKIALSRRGTGDSRLEGSSSDRTKNGRFNVSPNAATTSEVAMQYKTRYAKAKSRNLMLFGFVAIRKEDGFKVSIVDTPRETEFTLVNKSVDMATGGIKAFPEPVVDYFSANIAITAGLVVTNRGVAVKWKVSTGDVTKPIGYITFSTGAGTLQGKIHVSAETLEFTVFPQAVVYKTRVTTSIVANVVSYTVVNEDVIERFPKLVDSVITFSNPGTASATAFDLSLNDVAAAEAGVDRSDPMSQFVMVALEASL